MRFATAKELRTRTRQLLEEAQNGEHVAVTFHGKPIAVLVPFELAEREDIPIRPFEEAWSGIKATLAKSKARYATPEKALKASRQRG